MSYSCEISFKEIDSKDVYEFICNLKKGVIENINTIAKDNFIYSPMVRYFHQSFKELNSYAERESCYSWAKNCFTYRYFYFPCFNLLGVYGVPDCIKSMFDDTICFQNSVDQDYEFSTWDKVNLFKDIANRWQYCTDSYVINTLGLGKDDDIEYHRKSGCYSEIWNTYLSDTLFNDDSVVYFSCFGYYDLIYIQKYLDLCDNAGCKEGFFHL